MIRTLQSGALNLGAAVFQRDGKRRIPRGGVCHPPFRQRGDHESFHGTLDTPNPADANNIKGAVLVLHDVEGWKHEEIASELGMAVGSSKAQLHRARQLLRGRLGGEA